jgi:hypothetical protein
MDKSQSNVIIIINNMSLLHINCLILYFVGKFLFFFLSTRANFVIGLFAVKLARK